MAITLSELTAEMDTELKRSGTIDAEIKLGLQYAVRVMRQQRLHVQQRRLALIKTNAGQTWYSAFAGQEPTDPDQQDDLSEIPFSFDEPWYGGAVDQLLEVIDARHIDAAGRSTALKQLRLTEFNAARAQPYQHTLPSHFCLSAQQIGFWPTPAATGEWVVFSGYFNPVEPEDDNDTCIFFDEMRDLVKAHARWWLYSHALKDPPAAALADQEVTRLTRLARSAGTARDKTGRLAQNW